MPVGFPIPGSLQPVGYQFQHSEADDAVVMDLLVTSYIKQGIVIGFRFYPQYDNYMSQYSSTVTFCLQANLYPGRYIRLTDNGAKLLLLSDVDSEPDLVLGVALTPPFVQDFASAYVFWTPCLNKMEGIAYIGYNVDTECGATGSTGGSTGDHNFLQPCPPPTCVLPCQFATIVSICQFNTLGTRLVAYNGVRRGIYAQWINAWQLLKLGGRLEWDPPISDELYIDSMDQLRRTFFVALTPGQLMPIAYRPNVLMEFGTFPAQFALVVTERVPPGAYVWVAANCSSVDTVLLGPTWLWRAPTNCPVHPGTVIDMTNLGFGFVPKVNIGTIETAGNWPTGDFTISSFTVYAFSENVWTLENIFAVTALYVCASDCQLPSCLIPGQTTSVLPWPDCASILPIDCYKAGSIVNWGVFRQQLANMTPIPWLCQPLPKFRTLTNCPQKPECCNTCVDTSSSIGSVPMSGSCRTCF